MPPDSTGVLEKDKNIEDSFSCGDWGLPREKLKVLGMQERGGSISSSHGSAAISGAKL